MGWDSGRALVVVIVVFLGSCADTLPCDRSPANMRTRAMFVLQHQTRMAMDTHRKLPSHTPARVHKDSKTHDATANSYYITYVFYHGSSLRPAWRDAKYTARNVTDGS